MEFDKKHQKILDAAIEILKENVQDLVAVVVFGSFGTDYERKDSDLDMAFLTEKPNDYSDTVKTWNLAQEIAKTINRDVDLVNLRQISTVFSFQILTTGTLVYCSNELMFANFDNLVTSVYLRFQEERKDILDDYTKGIFYG